MAGAEEITRVGDEAIDAVIESVDESFLCCPAEELAALLAYRRDRLRIYLEEAL